MIDPETVQPNFRYLVRSAGKVGDTELFRFPNNLLSLYRQKLSSFERLHKDGSWRQEPPSSPFFNEMLTGWITTEDEIGPEAAKKLIETWKTESWPGRD